MRPIKKDSTDQSIVIRIIDSSDGTPETAVEHNTAGIDLWYRREAATKTSITEAALAALDSAHSDGGIKHIGDGYYRLDLPDAAVATGVNGVMVGGTVTGMIVIGCYLPLVDYDPYDTVRMGMTALPSAAADAAGGLPISDAGGLDVDAILADTNELQGDWVNAGRLDAILDIIAADTATDIPALIATAQADLDIITGASGVVIQDGTIVAASLGADCITEAKIANNAIAGEHLNATACTKIIDDFETQSQSDPTGFHVNVKEVNGTAQTANDNGADINAILSDTGTTLENHLADIKGGTFAGATDSLEAIRDRGDAAWTTGAGGSDRLLMVDTTIATLASQTSFTLTAGSVDNDAYNNCTIVIEDASTATQKAVGVISVYTGATKTVTLKYDPAIFTMATTDKVYILAENALKSTLANRQLNVAADGDIAGNVDGSVASVVGHTVQTGDSYAIVNSGTHGNSVLKSLIDTVDGVVDSILADTGTDGVVVASASKTEYALSATGADLILKDSTFALAIADAVWDEVITGATHGIVTSAGKRLLQLAAFAIHDGTAQAGTATTITLAAAANGGDGVYNRNLISISAGTGVGQTRTIVDYNGTTKVCVIDREWRINPDATSAYQILADDTPLVSDHGVAQGGTSTTITLRNYASATNDIYLCNIVIIVAGVGRGQARLVGSYNGTTKVVTICGDNWITTPDITSVYVMIPYGASCACCICDYALGQINAECDTALTDYDPPTRTEATTDKDAIITEVNANETKIDLLQTDSTAIKAKTDNLPSGISKNVLLNNFEFLMVLSSDHISPATGKTVDCQRSIDGGAFANCNSATATEVSAGIYKLDLVASDLNGDIITLKFSEATCDTTIITIKTDF